MWRHCLLVCLVALCADLSPRGNVARGQSVYGNVIPSTLARRLGLQRAWTTHVELDRARTRIGGVTIHVSNSRTFTVVEVASDGRKTHFSQRERGPDGQPLGLAGAERQAQNLIETLKALGRKFQLEKVEVPEITLYVQTDRGGLHAIDGETGRTRWVVKVGRSDQPSYPVAASDQYVAMVNGSQLYLISVLDGRQQWQRPLEGIPATGPGISAEMVFVPTLAGGIEGYPVENGRATPSMYHGAGAILARPTVSPLTLSWPTDANYLYVSQSNKLDVFARVEARQPFAASPARQPPNFLFAASLGGYVYSMDERDGRVLWRSATGEPVSQSPVPIGDSLYVVTGHAGMFSLSSRTGDEQWHVRGIRQFVASSDQRVYCATESRHLAALDAQSGAQLASISLPGLDLLVTNPWTDRLYVGTTNGTIQCLHEVRLDWPLRHAPEQPKDTPAQQPAAQPGPASPLPDLPPAAGGPPQQPGFDVFGPLGTQPAPEPDSQPAADQDSPGAEPIDPFGDLGEDAGIFDF